MAAIKPQPRDKRHELAGELLGIDVEQITVQHALMGEDTIYAWAKPLGETVLVDGDLRTQKFKPGVLLQEALAAFKG